jgi:CRISPR-associated protein Cas1
VVVYGNPLVQTSVWRNLAAASVPVIMLAARGKPQTAMLDSGLAVRLPLRRMQHRLAENGDACLNMAAWFLQKKLTSYTLSLSTLTTLYEVRAERRQEFSNAVDRAREKINHAESVNRIMGQEGTIARLWFTLLAETLPRSLRFAERNRRPPRDPVNSLLSLGYTMLLSEARQVLIADGFDPSLGFLHQDYPGREAMALDFMEIFRSGVDDFVLCWLHETSLDESSFFYRKQDGCRLSKSTRPLFFQAWAQHRETWPRYDSLGEPEQRSTLRELLFGQATEVRSQMTTIDRKDNEEKIPA